MQKSPTKVVLVFEKSEDSAPIQRILSSDPSVELHAVFKDQAKPKQLFVSVNKREVASMLGGRLAAAESLLISLAEKLQAGDIASFTREEALQILDSAGENPDKNFVETIVVDVNESGPFEKGVSYAEMEASTEDQAASIAKIDPVNDSSSEEGSDKPSIGIARLDEDVA